MSNKGYAVLLVLAGMVFGILLDNFISSPASARLPDEGRNATMNVPARVTTPTRPVVARPSIRVYPVGVVERGIPYAYVVKDGKLWYCEGQKARFVGLN